MKYQQSPSIIATELGDDEFVMMDVDIAKYFGLAETAGAIWKQFADPKTIDEVVDQLTAEYEVSRADCHAQTVTFVEDLCRRNLLVSVGTSPGEA